MVVVVVILTSQYFFGKSRSSIDHFLPLNMDSKNSKWMCDTMLMMFLFKVLTYVKLAKVNSVELL